jgi:DNA transformation protein
MGSNDQFAEYVLEQLQPAGVITRKAMFGGYGFWERGDMFALIDKSATLYFKVDEQTRPRYEAAGSGPFAPPGHNRGKTKTMTMPYYEVPADILDDQDQLIEWARAAIVVAHATAKKRPPPTKPAPKSKAKSKSGLKVKRSRPKSRAARKN